MFVGHHEKRQRTVMRRLVDRSSSTDKPAELTRKPDHRIRVRLLRAVKSDFMRADRVHGRGTVRERLLVAIFTRT